MNWNSEHSQEACCSSKTPELYQNFGAGLVYQHIFQIEHTLKKVRAE